MDRERKYYFSLLKNNPRFEQAIEKITLNKRLEEKEWSYVLSCSFLLANKYDEDKNNGYFQFAYYLVLKYSLATRDFKPLYYFSVNCGFYPIADYLFNKSNQDITISDAILNGFIDDYKNNSIVYIKEQFDAIQGLYKSEAQNRAFIAPTSYGKSEFIRKELVQNSKSKIGIIVPTKALIWQTFENIKKVAQSKECRVIIHDSEYCGEESFIGVFTQERALRLMQDNSVFFDILYIDEAHNIFEYDNRQLLLSRLIKLNRKNKPSCKVVFLSPLIKNVQNLLIKDEDYLIEEKRIDRNIKDMNVYFLDRYGNRFAYNRFINKEYDTKEHYESYLSYIKENSKNKNLLYFYSPRKIEDFIRRHVLSEPLLDDTSIKETADLIASYSNANYLMVESIKRGYIYIHSKVPDFLRDFLYHTFKMNDKIKFLVSNGCVLEGVNFPIESLFIIDAYALNENKLINLIGRVNRLNDVFKNNDIDLNKLCADVHFLQTEYYKDGIVKKLEYLRADVKDNVENPLLKTTTTDYEKGSKDIKAEKEYFESESLDKQKAIMLRNSIDKKYLNFDEAYLKIINRLGQNESINSVEKTLYFIKRCFIDGMEFSSESGALARLQNEEAIKYYLNYINYCYHSDLKAKLNYILSSFDYTLEHNQQKKTYVGKSFGTVPWRETDLLKVYISLLGLNEKERINVAIIKSKVEDDFTDYEIMPFVKCIFDLGIINESLYNQFAYGTEDQNLIKLYKAGFSSVLINFIKDNGLFNEITYKGYGFLASPKFLECLEKQDDIIKFELKKYLIEE